MKKLLLILFIAVLFVGCDTKENINRLSNISIGEKFNKSEYMDDYIIHIHKSSTLNTVYKIYYTDFNGLSDTYFITTRNSDSVVTAVWSK